MNVSYRWLRDLAPGLDTPPDVLAEHLALRGAPVEEATELGAGLGDLVVGRVLEAGRHPDADRLSLCRVDAGGEAPLQVVCGAPNVKAGAFYPFAPVGAVLPGGLKIKKAKIRGVHSEGMLCSERELGLGRDHAGIMELTGDLAVGQPLTAALALDDVRMDVEVSPNRGDLLSHMGVAREVAPGGAASVALPPIPGGTPYEAPLRTDPVEIAAGGARVRIDDPDLCYRFLAIVIRGVTVGPSPDWLANRLRAVGSQPINNVVDATNYAMLEMGHPMHAYDLARLAGGAVIARRARPGEAIVTLDGTTRKLTPDMLAICDEKGPVGIGGVMGGADSEVSDATTDVLLEAALFDPPSVRATRRALDMSTDASYRFERGVDPDFHETAIRRAAELIVAIAGGTPDPELLDVAPRAWSPDVLALRPERVGHLLGVDFDVPTLKGLLEPLGFRVDEDGDGPLRVTVPGYRSYDVTREVDLIEEVARTHGYDAFPADLETFRPSSVPDHPLFQLEDRLRSMLSGLGLFEAQTPAFVSSSEGEVALKNPISQNDTHMRRWMVPSLLRRVSYNFHRGARSVRLYEMGTSFRTSAGGEPPSEATHLALALTGASAPPHWSGPERDVDVWDLKALAERVALAAYGPEASVVPGEGEHPFLTGQRLAILDGSGAPVGEAGRADPVAVDAPAWAGPVWALEMRLPAVPAPPEAVLARELPGFPAVDRDLALLVPDAVPAAEVRAAMQAAGGALLERIDVFDVYQGDAVPEGHRSIGYRLRFQSPERTLQDADVERSTNRILKKLEEGLGVHARA